MHRPFQLAFSQLKFIWPVLFLHKNTEPCIFFQKVICYWNVNALDIFIKRYSFLVRNNCSIPCTDCESFKKIKLHVSARFNSQNLYLNFRDIFQFLNSVKNHIFIYFQSNYIAHVPFLHMCIYLNKIVTVLLFVFFF